MANYRFGPIRQEAQVSLETLSGDVGISVSQLSRFESGDREPRVSELIKIAQRFRVPWQEMIEEGASPYVSVPLISWVSAGRLETADHVEHEGDPIPIAGLPHGDWFALRVKGDSMDRISPPDSVIVANRRDKRLVPNGCYIIGDGDGGATYKRFRPEPMRFEPVSTNPTHEPIFPDHEPTIIGRVRRTILEM